MSFSGKIKEELSKQIGSFQHCKITEFTTIIQYTGKIYPSEMGIFSKEGQIENDTVSRKYFTLLKKTFKIGVDIETSKENFDEKVLKTIKIVNDNGDIVGNREIINPLLLKRSCCRRSFLRGAFLTIGSISDPEKGYHLEFVCSNHEQAEQLQEIIATFKVEAKIIVRKKYFVVYIKEGAGIVEMLNIMGAHISLMELENLRIVKDMRNSINRRVNCEAANITKTVEASSNQMEDIAIVKEFYGFENLRDNLKEMAEIRLEYPDASLKELGEFLNPSVGKSGVNHRLRKLKKIADEIRSNQ